MLIVALFLAVWIAPASPRHPSPRPGKIYSGWGCPPGKSLRWYVRDGQWKADARTAVAILEYVLSPET